MGYRHTALVVVVSAATAAVLPGVFALLGTALGERRGRRAWARDKRLEAASGLLEKADRTLIRRAVANSGLGAAVARPLSASEIPVLFAELVEAQSVLILLGPDELAEASKALVGAVFREGRLGNEEPDRLDTRAARDGFVKAVQHALRNDPPV